MNTTISPLQLALPGYDQSQAYFGVNPPPLERMWNPPRDRVQAAPPLISAPFGVGAQAADRGGAPIPTDQTFETLGSLSKNNASLHQQAMESEQAMSAAAASAASAAAASAQQQRAAAEAAATAPLAVSHQKGEIDMMFWVGIVILLIVAEYFLSHRVNT